MSKKLPSVKLVQLRKSAIYLMATMPGTTTRLFKNLAISVDAKVWDSKNEMVKKAHPEALDLNGKMWAEKAKISTAFQLDLVKGIIFTASHIKKRLLFDYSDPAQDFYAFAKEQVLIANYSPETRRTYLSELSKMEQYSSLLSFADINYQWIQGYEQYMREKLSNHPNTIWKSLKFINTMLNTTIKIGGIISENPFKNYSRGNYKQGIPDYIEWSEAELIRKEIKGKKLNDNLKLVGHYCLLSYYTGLRFADAVKFDYDKKVIEDTTGRRLVLYAQKNGEIVSIGFNKYIADITDYLRDKPINISNQEYNANIKLLCASAKIYKQVSSHDFRHGFAMRCAELDMSIDEVQKLMGHNKRSSTEIYFRIKNKRLDEAMQKWDSAKTTPSRA